MQGHNILDSAKLPPLGPGPPVHHDVMGTGPKTINEKKELVYATCLIDTPYFIYATFFFLTTLIVIFYAFNDNRPGRMGGLFIATNRRWIYC